MQLAPCWIAGLSLCYYFLTAWAAHSDDGGHAVDVNTTSNSTTLISDPGNDSDDQRSIQDIIWSCLATIFACTWVSIHPNIPPLNDSRIKRFSRRVGITVLALIAPELVVIWALRQWLVSRRVAREYAELGWEQVHGFFALMGGFMLYDKHGTPYKVLYLHRLTFFRSRPELRIPAEDIWDKSKGDVLAKGLVVLQTMWFILQCIARASRGLAITQLEVLTLAFAVLNFVIYGLWWNKPLGVERPVRVTIDNELKTGFLHSTAFQQSSYYGPLPHIYRWLGFQLIERIIQGKDDDGFSNADDTPTFAPMTFLDPSSDLSADDTPTFASIAFLDPSSDLSVNHDTSTVSTVGPAFSSFPDELLGVPTFYTESHRGRPDRLYSGKLENEYLGSFRRSPALFATPIAVAFGAIHFISWSSVFSTKAEQRLWHISTIILIAVPLFPVLHMIWLGLLNLGPARNTFVIHLVFWSTRLAILFYVVARLYLIVEAFASLRSLPPSAFQTVEWTSFIPHV